MANFKNTKYAIIGAGIHGLSTAYHLALELKQNGKGSGTDILVIDKGGIGAGASGIACGVVRNNYYQPAMRELMAQCVEVWESDPEAFSYHPVGYMQISPECMREDVNSIFEQQRAIGYESEFIEGTHDSSEYMKSIFSDWRAQGITSVLHEKRGGYANNSKSVYGLAKKAENEGVKILTGVTVTGFKFDDQSEAIKALETDKGDISCEYLIVGAGPWIKSIWEQLELPKTVKFTGKDGEQKKVPMWIYWSLQEGTLGVDPNMLKTDSGDKPPVIHVDSDAPLTGEEGETITEDLWGIYYKPDFHFGGVQGGSAPFIVQSEPDSVKVDPYGPASPDFVVGPDFAYSWCSALSHCQKRFEGMSGLFKKEPSGGIGAFSPDSFPIFDEFRQNCYIIADSNHGYKMLGVGKLVAEKLMGKPSSLLTPFRFSRYEEKESHPTSNSPFPWS